MKKTKRKSSCEKPPPFFLTLSYLRDGCNKTCSKITLWIHIFDTKGSLYIYIFYIHPCSTTIYFTQTNPQTDGLYILSERRRKCFYIHHKSNNRKALRRKAFPHLCTFSKTATIFFLMDSQVGNPLCNHSNNCLKGGAFPAASGDGWSGLHWNPSESKLHPWKERVQMTW